MVRSHLSLTCITTSVSSDHLSLDFTSRLAGSSNALSAPSLTKQIKHRLGLMHSQYIYISESMHRSLSRCANPCEHLLTLQDSLSIKLPIDVQSNGGPIVSTLLPRETETEEMSKRSIEIVFVNPKYRQKRVFFFSPGVQVPTGANRDSVQPNQPSLNKGGPLQQQPSTSYNAVLRSSSLPPGLNLTPEVKYLGLSVQSWKSLRDERQIFLNVKPLPSWGTQTDHDPDD